MFFFCKQKTAYEMRISDWSSDVCSSDLHDILLNEINEYNREKFETEAVELFPGKSPRDVLALPFAVRKEAGIHHPYKLADLPFPHRLEQIGSASCRERVCQDVSDSAVAVHLTQNT